MPDARYPPWAMLGPATIARWALRTQTAAVRVEGREHVPASGPVLLLARHFHHLLDGAVLVRYVPRPVHIVVALDWARDARERRWMERACRAARYPVLLRAATVGARGGYRPDELARYVRAGLRDAAALLRAGRVVLLFPEGYPNVDPAFAQKRGDDDVLPFAPGYRHVLAQAEHGGAARVTVLPVGFRYARGAKWSIRARIGAPLDDRGVAAVERAVRALC